MSYSQPIDKTSPHATIVSENMMNEIKKLANDFIRDLEERKKRTARTVEHYDLYLQRFLKWLDQNNVTDFNQIDFKVIASYRAWLENFKDPIRKTLLNKSTANYYLIAVRGLMEFATRKGFKGLRAIDVKLSKISKENLKYLKKDELVLLLEAPNEVNQDTLITLRDKAVLEMLFCTGLKVSSLANATRDQIDKSKNKFIFINLGKQKRELIFSNQASEALQKYLSKRKDKNQFLFISHDNAISGRKAPKGLSARSIERTIERYAKHANLKKRVTPQIIRNTYLVNKLLQGDDIEKLKNELGFSSINTLKDHLRKI
ncbi:MAG: Tyrosine recombinase XerC [Parcubacteria group bacterium GW2011_GWC2_39_14]|nr:MAG: Tyrosine recombinase XerC [Parcubacteria group bacterium GW2011_GWC2_39_14]